MATPPLLLLQGDLGAGKTCLVQGLAEGLGIHEPITSPTFALAHHYRGETTLPRPVPPLTSPGAARMDQPALRVPTALVHLDLYRLEQPAAALELFAQEEEEARALGAVLAVEWPERLGFVPEPCWRVELEVAGERRVARLRPPASDGSAADLRSDATPPPPAPTAG
ncbi:MAG: tRNA (adenosine(37)-N6)-threonylcarbamoyltransferase complex ATPase subunit type 1 TsaE [Cyanobacteriota bacterium]